MNSKKGSAMAVILIVLVVMGVLIGIYIYKSSGNGTNKTEENDKEVTTQNVIADSAENRVSSSTAESIFVNIPKTYEETVAPFNEEFKLTAAMNKILEENNEYPDFSEANVIKIVKKIFGVEETLDKSQLTQDKIEDSIYYYSEELESYTVLPVGLAGIYTEQVLKEVTETDDYYYVYTYCLIGEYVYGDNEESETIVIGDKSGGDLVEKFTGELDSKKWVEDYESKLPVFRYSLKKSEDGYYLTEVEQVN